MIWFTWRQFRAQTWAAAAAAGSLGVLLVIAGFQVAHLYSQSGAADCTSACDSVLSTFIQEISTGFLPVVFAVATGVLYLAPPLIGAFWGAPLVAREFETGTHLLAWNQSVTRTRWLVTKLAVVGGVSAATMGVLSLAMQWFARYIDSAHMDRILPMSFGSRGIVPVAYAVFAFVLGVTAGIFIRRTVPAMAVTLAVYTAAVAVMPAVVRQHLLTPATTVRPLETDNLFGIMIRSDDITVIGAQNLPGAWVISNETITSSGEVFTGPSGAQCGPSASLDTCVGWIDTLGLRQSLAYQPAGNFWPLQWIESGIFLGLAAVLAGICFYRIRRRLA